MAHPSHRHIDLSRIALAVSLAVLVGCDQPADTGASLQATSQSASLANETTRALTSALSACFALLDNGALDGQELAAAGFSKTSPSGYTKPFPLDPREKQVTFNGKRVERFDLNGSAAPRMEVSIDRRGSGCDILLFRITLPYPNMVAIAQQAVLKAGWVKLKDKDRLYMRDDRIIGLFTGGAQSPLMTIDLAEYVADGRGLKRKSP